MARGAKRQSAPASAAGGEGARERGSAGSLEALSEAIESGAGLPAVARAAAAALGASVALIDRSSAVLAVAARSAAEEKRLLAEAAGVESVPLRVADEEVGVLRYRAAPESASESGDSAEPRPAALRTVVTLLGLEVQRARSPEWASDEASGAFVLDVLERRLEEAGEVVAAAAELGSDLSAGAGVVIARAVPRAVQSEDWRARLLTVTLRAVRGAGNGALAGLIPGDPGEVAALVPAPDSEPVRRAASAADEELHRGLSGFAIAVGYSRHAEAGDLYRAGKEAQMAANVGAADERSPLAFDETGSYRLLLPAMSEDPAELRRFYEETVAPLVAYDEQYETELVTTVEAYLDNDGSVTPTAETLFTHRHTIRYRLERVRELTGHDMSSTDGREKLGLGLKAMRVLGIPPPHGPAQEPGGRRGGHAGK